MTTRVYVGNLPINIRTREVEDLFYKYGPIRDIDVKQPSRPPAYAFVEFDDPRDAEDAIKGRDGYEFDGLRLRVEPSNNGRRGRRGGKTRGSSRRGEHIVYVSNLPNSASWQDLKDCMRKAGDVIHTNVDRRGHGTVVFSNKEDMYYALDHLDDTEFKNRYDKSYIRVSTRKKGRSRSRSRSYSRSRSRSRSYSRNRSRSRSGSRNGSKSRSRSRSGSKSKKRSKSLSQSKSQSRSRSRSPIKEKRQRRSRSHSSSKSNEQTFNDKSNLNSRKKSDENISGKSNLEEHKEKTRDKDIDNDKDGHKNDTQRVSENAEDVDVASSSETSNTLKNSSDPKIDDTNSNPVKKTSQTLVNEETMVNANEMNDNESNDESKDKADQEKNQPDWKKLKVVELRAELKKRGLDAKGVKADLIRRLEENA